MRKAKIFVAFICLLVIFAGSAESQTTESKDAEKVKNLQSSKANANGCGAIITTTVERRRPSDAASFISYSFNFLFRKKKIIADYNCPAEITSFVLSASEIDLNCPVGQIFNANNQKIAVSTEALDADNDPLTYIYFVSGGKIVGQGAKVVWDLSGEKTGIYTITAGADDVWGVSKTITKEVKIIECAAHK